MSQNILARPVFRRLNVNSILALAGIAGPLILITTDLAVASSDPGYNLIQHSISSLAWAKLGWLQTLGFLAIGLLTEVFVAGLFFNIHGARGFGFGIGLLALFGFGLLLIGAFHTDPAVGPRTIDGAIHGVAAKTIFWLFPVAALLIAPSLKKDAHWRSLYIYTLAAAIFAFLFMLSSIVLPEDQGWFGLFERILVADEVIWEVVVAVGLLRLSVKKG